MKAKLLCLIFLCMSGCKKKLEDNSSATYLSPNQCNYVDVFLIEPCMDLEHFDNLLQLYVFVQYHMLSRMALLSPRAANSISQKHLICIT